MGKRWIIVLREDRPALFCAEIASSIASAKANLLSRNKNIGGGA
jgi:hypothetical protein